MTYDMDNILHGRLITWITYYMGDLWHGWFVTCVTCYIDDILHVWLITCMTYYMGDLLHGWLFTWVTYNIDYLLHGWLINWMTYYILLYGWLTLYDISLQDWFKCHAPGDYLYFVFFSGSLDTLQREVNIKIDGWGVCRRAVFQVC